MASKETATQLIEMANALAQELDTYVQKSNKSAAKRARKLTLDMEKVGKVFRKESVLDSKAE